MVTLKRKGTTIKEATGFARWFLTSRGSMAWTSCWNTVYILREHMSKEWVIAHEMVHIEQMKRDGKLLMMLKTLYYMLRYDYHDSPYEIEAHKVSDTLKKLARQPLFER